MNDEHDDLATIYIRAHVGGKVGTYSLRELVRRDEVEAISEWFLARLHSYAGEPFDIDGNDASVITTRLVNIIERLTGPLIRVNHLSENHVND